MITDDDILKLKDVSVPTAAEYLGMSVPYLRNGLEQGVFPFGSCVFFGNKRYFNIQPKPLVYYKHHGLTVKKIVFTRVARKMKGVEKNA